jgi:hypothetical protein
MNADETQMNAEEQTMRIGLARNGHEGSRPDRHLAFICVHLRFIRVHLRSKDFGLHHSPP